MSQKKMDAYKEAKKNKKQIEKKQKRNKILGWIFGILAALAVIAGSVFLIYYTNVMLPEKQAAEAAAALQEESQQTETEDAEVPAGTTESDDTAGSAAEDTDTTDDAAAEDGENADTVAE